MKASPSPSWSRTRTACVLALAGLCLTGFVVGGSPPALGEHSPSAALPSPASLLAEASSSLSHGLGPAAGQPLACAASGTASASCSTPLASPLPAGAVWTNLTHLLHPVPSARATGQMTYDAADGYILYYGGEIYNGSTYIPQRDTWTFADGLWTNITLHISGGPPPNSVATSLAYDPWLGEVVLFGGENGSRAPTDLTWTYVDETWTNVTGTVGAPPSPRILAPFAADTTSDQMLLVGGTQLGTTLLGDTWTFSATGWTNITDSVSNSAPHLVYTAMSNDPAEGGLLLFGFNQNILPIVTQTYVFSDNSWTNLTATLSQAPPPDLDPGMEYVAAVHGVLLSSSIAADVTTADTYTLIDTWVFAGGEWTNVTGTTGGPYGAALSAWAEDPAGTIWQFSGTNNGVDLTATMFAFSLLPSVTSFTASPSAVDLGAPVNFTAQVAGGIDPVSTSLHFGDGTFANGTLATAHTYGTVGTYTALFNVTDLADRSATQSLTVTVNPGLASGPISASPPTPSTGEAVAFNLTVVHGTSPYTYAWTFGDGASSTSSNPSHAYGASGSYHVNVTVTDAAGGKVSQTVSVTVSATSSSFSFTSGAGLYLVLGVIILVVAVVVALAVRARRKPTSAPAGTPPSGAAPVQWTPPAPPPPQPPST
jgi:PKD repeat protein